MSIALRSWLLPIVAAFLMMGSSQTNAQVSAQRQPAATSASTKANILSQAYCRSQGGTVEFRQPFYGTNGTTPLKLAGSHGFCRWTKKSDGSSIYVFLDTLVTKQPTLAVLAYLGKVKPNNGCQGSPGSCYCTQLGGTDLFGGISAAGGGWVLKTDQQNVVSACVFPDLSSIDSYGLFYHSADIIRGKDLTKVFRYKGPGSK